MAKTLLVCLFLWLSAPALAQPDIQVQGLFAGKAVLSVNGQMRMLSEGDTSPEGIRLLSATTSSATIEFDGEQLELGLSSRISGAFTRARDKEVRLLADSNGHYLTNARINGRQARVILDTGATSVAINSRQARALGLRYENAPVGVVSTASGRVQSHQIVLGSVMVGDIEVNAVPAVVLEGDFPEIILLGNSFLSKVKMQQDGGVMVLRSAY